MARAPRRATTTWVLQRLEVSRVARTTTRQTPIPPNPLVGSTFPPQFSLTRRIRPHRPLGGLREVRLVSVRPKRITAGPLLDNQAAE
jgi:hypothetical protein